MHNSYIQMYADTGILGVAAMVAAYICFLKLTAALSPRKRGVWYAALVGLTGSVVAGGVFSLLDVTTMGVVRTGTSIIYLSVPLLWIFAALLVVAHQRVAGDRP